MTKIAFLFAVSLAACATQEAKPAGTSGSSSQASAVVPPSSASAVGSAPNPTTRPNQAVTAADVVGKWQHAFEKTADGLVTFVAASEKLPAARFRKSFELSADGKARVLCAAPDDAHAMRDGTWQLASGVLTIEAQCFGPKPEVVKYSVERASPGELALRPLP